MPNTAEPPGPWRDALLRMALRSYPAPDRAIFGPDLLAAAADLCDSGSSLPREAGGLLRGGVVARLGRYRRGLLTFDRRPALAALTEFLTAFVVAVWTTAAVVRMAGGTGAGNGPTVGAILLLTALLTLTIAVARRQRILATLAAGALLVQVALSAAWLQWRGDIVTASPAVHLHVGPWWFGPSLAWSLLPFVILLVGSCWALEPAAARVPGLRRPPRESPWIRGLLLLTPAAALMLIVVTAPGFVVVQAGGETTELPGLLFLMLVVGSFWLATSSLGGRDHLSAASALVGLAAVPSVAYGFAGMLTPGVAGLESEPARLGVVLGWGALMVLLTLAVFLVALARVGLREADRGA